MYESCFNRVQEPLFSFCARLFVCALHRNTLSRPRGGPRYSVSREDDDSAEARFEEADEGEELDSQRVGSAGGSAGGGIRAGATGGTRAPSMSTCCYKLQ